MNSRKLVVDSIVLAVVVAALTGCPDTPKAPAIVSRDRANELINNPLISEDDKRGLESTVMLLNVSWNSTNRDEKQVNQWKELLDKKIAEVEQRIRDKQNSQYVPVEVDTYYDVEITEDRSSIGGRAVDWGKPYIEQWPESQLVEMETKHGDYDPIRRIKFRRIGPSRK